MRGQLRTALFFLVLAASQIGFASILSSSNYYGSSDSDLKRELHNQVTYGHRSVGYNQARKILMGDIHLENIGGQYGIKDIYCMKVFNNDDFHGGQPPEPGQVPDSNVLNVEHTWPQHRFSSQFPKDIQKSDLHHLLPSDSQMNSSRGHLEFGAVLSTKPLKCNTSELGSRNHGDLAFEPPNETKGMIARAIFYFSIRYELPIDSEEEQDLKLWNQLYPVSQLEQDRNNKIESYQGNRNPFIDDTSLVDQISDF